MSVEIPTCFSCHEQSLMSCLCEGLPLFFCNSCYWPHVESNFKAHFTTTSEVAIHLDTLEKVQKFMRTSENYNILESCLENAS